VERDVRASASIAASQGIEQEIVLYKKRHVIVARVPVISREIVFKIQLATVIEIGIGVVEAEAEVHRWAEMMKTANQPLECISATQGCKNPCSQNCLENMEKSIALIVLRIIPSSK